MGIIISFCDAAGCGYKALLSVNTAILLAQQTKEKVLIIDYCATGTREIETLLGARVERTLEDVVALGNDAMDSRLLGNYFPQNRSGIAVLGSRGVAVDSTRMVDILSLLSDCFPFIIINTSFEKGEMLQAVLDVSHHIALPVMPHLLSVLNAEAFLSQITSWHLPLEMVKLIPLLRSEPESLDPDHIGKLLELPVYSVIPLDQAVAMASINHGTPAALSHPHSAFTQSLKKLSLLLRDTPATATRAPYQTSSSGTAPAAETDASYISNLKKEIHEELISKLDLNAPDLKGLKNEQRASVIRNRAREIVQGSLSSKDAALSREFRIQLVEELLNEALSFGCIEPLLKDPEITEIMINGHDRIYIEKSGKVELTKMHFDSAAQLMTIVDRIVSPIGRRVDESSPLVDARLPDGSRVNAIIPPLSLNGPTVTIRKFSKRKLLADDLVSLGALSPAMADFLKACVQMRKNIIISGGTGSGKTTLLNVISSFIPDRERIVTIEDSAELRLPQEHVVRLESRPASIEGTGEIPIRKLVINALRMRPDRIVVGECRGGETLDMLQAMNTGHDGSLTTLHANSPRDAVTRLTTMVLMSGMELPEHAIKEQIASAVHFIVQLNRLSDGSRKITEIAELRGMKEGMIELTTIFTFEQLSTEEGKVMGRFSATGALPRFVEGIEVHGMTIDRHIFDKGR